MYCSADEIRIPRYLENNGTHAEYFYCHGHRHLNWIEEFAVKYHDLNKKFMSFSVHSGAFYTHDDVNGIS